MEKTEGETFALYLFMHFCPLCSVHCVSDSKVVLSMVFMLLYCSVSV